jgi:hypothetical protein
MRYADKLFRDLHPGVLPKHGTAAQWHRVAQLAYANQGDVVAALKRHNTRTRWWGRIGDEATARANAAGAINPHYSAIDRVMTDGSNLDRHYAERKEG